MSIDPRNKFDDPALKAAVKRACGREIAPPGLRSRILRALDPGWATSPSRTSTDTVRATGWRNNRWVGLAAAAVILVSFALLYNRLTNQPGSQVAQINLPASLANAMIITADKGSGAVEVNLVGDPDNPDYAALSRTLQERLNQPVLATALGADWKLKTAGVADIGGVPASQLVFVRGNDTISLFSVKGDQFYTTEEGSEYDQTVRGHPIAGFVYKRAVHCVVGAPGVSPKEVAKLRDKLRGSLTAVSTRSDARGSATSDVLAYG